MDGGRDDERGREGRRERGREGGRMREEGREGGREGRRGRKGGKGREIEIEGERRGILARAQQRRKHARGKENER